MGERTSFVVQGFEHVGGRLVATSRASAQNERHALRQAEAVARRAAGAVAIKYVLPDGMRDGAEAGMPERATVLGAFGDVPDALADGLAGG